MLLPPVAVAGRHQTAPPASQPATQPSREVPAELAAVLARLDERDYARREQASADLLAMLSARPALREFVADAARVHPSPEVRTRAAAALEGFEEQRLFGETRVTLHVEKVHPRQLIEEFSRRSGVPLELWPQDPWQNGLPGAPVSLELNDVPFWDAIWRVAQVTGLMPIEHQPGPPGGIALGQHGESTAALPTFHHGAFAVQLRRLYRTSNSTVELGLGPDGRVAGNRSNHSNLAIEMRLLVEPKIRLTGSVTQPILEEAVDEQGNDLLISRDPRETHFGRFHHPGNVPAWSMATAIELDAQKSKQSQSIARLSGRFDAEVALSMETLEIPLAGLVDVSELRDGQPRRINRSYTLGPHRLELTSVQKQGDQQIQFEFNIRSSELSQSDPELWVRLQTLVGSIRLEDADGKRWDQGGGATDINDERMRVQPTFTRWRDNVGPAAKLVWETPTRTAMITIPFEFHDIPLPLRD